MTRFAAKHFNKEKNTTCFLIQNQNRAQVLEAGTTAEGTNIISKLKISTISASPIKITKPSCDSSHCSYMCIAYIHKNIH